MKNTLCLDTFVAVFNSQADARRAVKEAKMPGFNIRDLSIAGRYGCAEEHVRSHYTARNGVKFWGLIGACWGADDTAFFFAPGVGSVMVSGPLMELIFAALDGGVPVHEISALGVGLNRMGIPKDRIVQYESDVAANKFLVVGLPQRMAHAVGVAPGVLQAVSA